MGRYPTMFLKLNVISYFFKNYIWMTMISIEYKLKLNIFSTFSKFPTNSNPNNSCNNFHTNQLNSSYPVYGTNSYSNNQGNTQKSSNTPNLTSFIFQNKPVQAITNIGNKIKTGIFQQNSATIGISCTDPSKTGVNTTIQFPFNFSNAKPLPLVNSEQAKSLEKKSPFIFGSNLLFENVTSLFPNSSNGFGLNQPNPSYSFPSVNTINNTDYVFKANQIQQNSSNNFFSRNKNILINNPREITINKNLTKQNFSF